MGCDKICSRYCGLLEYQYCPSDLEVLYAITFHTETLISPDFNTWKILEEGSLHLSQATSIDIIWDFEIKALAVYSLTQARMCFVG